MGKRTFSSLVTMSSTICASHSEAQRRLLGVVALDGSARLLERRADVVVHRPHHLARALDAVLLEEGEELVLLAQVVPLDLAEALQGVDQRRP